MKIIYNFDGSNDPDVEEKLLQHLLQKKQKNTHLESPEKESLPEKDNPPDKSICKKTENEDPEIACKKTEQTCKQKSPEKDIFNSNIFQSPKEKDNAQIVEDLISSTRKLESFKACQGQTQTHIYKSLSSRSEQDAISIILCYRAQRKTIPFIPSNYEDLRSYILQNIRSRKGIPVHQSDFNIYFFDYETERCYIESDNDLEGAYRLASQATPKNLKICIDIERDINKEDKQHSVQQEESDLESDSDGHGLVRELFELIDFELDRSVIIREGNVYTKYDAFRTRAHDQTNSVYTCVDFSNYRCTGKWETKPLMFNGEYGRSFIPHSLPPEKHTNSSKDDIIKKYNESLLTGLDQHDISLERREIKTLIRQIIDEDPSLTVNQVIAKLKIVFTHTKLLPRQSIVSMVTQSRNKRCAQFSLDDGVDISRLKTLRGSAFGRGSGVALVDGKPKHFLYFYSDFQLKIAKEVKDDPNLHLFIDGTFKCCPCVWSQLLNICVFHRGKNLYFPIAHVLMQSETYEGYKTVLNWFNSEIGLQPRFITTDFELSLITASKEVYPNADIVPCFFHFTKALWMNAAKHGLKKRNVLSQTKQLMFSLKALAFRPPEKVYRRFELIRDNYSQKSNSFKSFLEYFEHTWMDRTFKIKDWNYYEKLSNFEELALTNNGLESFHQMIRSQLRRTKPALSGFVDVLGRVELMKKTDYEEDKIKGDPQYNRCWPSSVIFKELYTKACQDKPKEDGTKEDLKLEDEKITQDYQSENPKDRNSIKKLEREVLFLFEEFDSANTAMWTDSRIRRENQISYEIQQECKTSKANKTQGLLKEPDLREVCIENDRPRLIKEMEKATKAKYSDTYLEKDMVPGLIEEFDDEEEARKLLKGELIANYWPLFEQPRQYRNKSNDNSK
ncbi:unnamed protein product [Moneuplotes crassus]|uniref:MULE transposase domain-containing protein n=1 Tax=Euplotes crassus TaxID=5936 RepID=A0AAD2D9K9_EUPCR|nr:unnamed protein product [Moneuplotes crassus]